MSRSPHPAPTLGAWLYCLRHLHQIKEASKGTLNLGRTGIGAIPALAEAFDYDPAGNCRPPPSDDLRCGFAIFQPRSAAKQWTRYRRDEDGESEFDQSRVSNRANQLVQVDGSSDGIAYDASGNATSLPPDASGDWAAPLRLVWDAWNRLVEVRDADEQIVARYAYDGLFRRTVRVAGGEVRHEYYYNDQWSRADWREARQTARSAARRARPPRGGGRVNCVEERGPELPPQSSSTEPPSPSEPSSSSSPPSSSPPSSSLPSSWPTSFAELLELAPSAEPERVLCQYVWGARPGHRDELILRDRDAEDSGTLDERLYCLMDYFDPVAVVDREGEVVERYGWTAFGLREVMAPDWSAREASAFDWSFGFHGQFLDGETGYYNYGFRYYVAWLGRWLNRNPIEEEAGGEFVRVCAE